MKTACRMGASAILLLGLAACGTTERSMVAAMSGKGEFAQSLHEFYLKLGDRERAEYDWRDSDHFYEKALAAASSAKVEADAVASRDIAADKMDELAKARENLVKALGSGAERQPRAAAMAQSSFDCWLEQQEEGHQPDDIKACRDDFDAAMKVLTFVPKAAAPASAPAPARIAGQYVVHFDFNDIDPDSEGGRTIRQIAADFKSAKPKKVVVTGHTDTVGSEKANMRLGLDRAQVVKSSLIAAGVSAGAMTTRSMGEAHPAAPTGDNVREPRNRRVEVVFE